MSYDVHLYADLGGPEPVSVGSLCANMTWNVGPMYVAACGSSPSAWDGKPAHEVADICAAILDEFNRNPAKYRKLDPPNGWGDFEGARAFIQKINDACRAAPNAMVSVG